MGKTLGYGEITVANMTEPFTVMLTNEAQQFATDSNRKVTSAQSYYTDIIVIRGSQERTDYTIGNITSGSGITVSKSSKRITFSVSAGTTIGADTGVIEIPITLDGQTVKKQFSWSCGKQGPQGVKGKDGTSIKITSKSVTYQTSTSGTTTPTGTWSTTVPMVNNGQYLWTKTTVQYSDGNKTEAYSVSYKGTNGTNGTSVTVSKTEVTYQVSTSGTTAPTGTWSTTMPSCDQGQYLWTKTYVKYSDGKETTSYSVSYKGVDGEKFAFNMLRETNQGSKHWVNMGASGKYSVESITTEDSINAVKLICTEPIASNEWQFCDFSDYEMLKSLKASTTYTLSYDIKTNRSGKILHNIKTGGGQKLFFANDIACKVLGNETWEHVSLKMTSGTTLPNLDGQVIYMFGDALSKVGYSIIKNLKLTEGIVDTPWAPHPEDLEGRGVTEITQWYLATNLSSGVTAGTSGWSTDITTQKITADKKYLWNCHRTKYSDGTMTLISTPAIIGVYGDKGDNAKNLSIAPSSQYFKSTDGGKTFAPDTITIKPTIQGEINFGKWQYSIDGGVSFADVVSGQKGLTISNNVLIVSKDSSLYSDAVTMVTFRAVASDSSFYDTCSIAKIYDVSDIQIGGRNLVLNSDKEYVMGYGIPNTTWTDGYAYIGLPTTRMYDEILPQNNAFLLHPEAGKTYTQTIWIETDADVIDLNAAQVSWFTGKYGHVLVAAKIIKLADNSYKLTSTYTVTKEDSDIRLFDIMFLFSALDISNSGTYLKFGKLKVEQGNVSTDWTPAPEDLQTAILSTKNSIDSVSSKVDTNTKSIQDKVSKTTYERELTLVKGDLSKANEGLNKWRYEIYPKSLFDSEDQSKSTIDIFARNLNLVPSQTVLLDDASLSTGMGYGDNHIAYALTFVKMSAKKDVTTKMFNDDGASLYVNGGLIITRPSEYTNGEEITFTLAQGWNCIEVVVNERGGDEGFRFSTTLSKLSECQMMNCYYGTPVARQSRITNQLVDVTKNLTGVTSTVQDVMTAVGNSGNITEFKNNYSKWKQNVDKIESRVGEKYVTNEKFDGLEIGGRNLLTKDDCNMSKWQNLYPAHCKITSNDYSNHIDYVPTGGEWEIIYKKISVTKGQKYILSFDYKVNKAYNYLSGQKYGVYLSTSVPTNAAPTNIITDGQYVIENTVTSIKRGVITFTAPIDTLYIVINGGCINDNQTGLSFEFNKWKLEKGNISTDWTPAPEDDEINGQNLVSNLPSNWEQGSFNDGKTNVGCDYDTNKSSMTTRIRVKELVPVSGTITISNAYSNQSKKPIQNMITAFDVNKKWLGSSYVSTAWSDFPRIVDMKDAKYIAVIVRYKDESAITPSDISQICLKIERGTSATPFTLAPEDVNGKIVNVETIANQTAKKFEWIVKGGDSSSNFTLTDRVADLVADRINFNGLVKFSGLNTDAKNEIGKVAQSKVDGLDVGGRNLALQSKDFTSGEQYWSINSNFTRSVDSDGFTVLSIKRSGAGLEWNRAIPHNYIPVEEMHRGIIVSFDFMCDKVSELDRGCICALQIFNSGGGRIGWYESQDILSGAQCKLSAPLSDGKWIRVQIPFSEGNLKTTYGNSDAVAYTSVSFNLVANGSIHFKKIKIEYGNKATDWTPAPEDYLPQVDLVSNWTTNTTWIDGGKIYTNSITADKIATDAIKSRNYISSGGTQGSFLNLSDGSFTSPNLSWDSNGNLIAKNANLSGEITATNGSIAGWTIISNKMYTTGSGKYTGIGKYGSAYAFWAGATSNDNGNSAVFKVGHTGKLTATDADITGTITATNGKIGRYDITSTYLMTNSGSNASGIGGNQAFWAGAEDSNSAPFRVGYDGALLAENAVIRGSIETGNLGDEGDTVSIINGHIGIQGTSNNVEIYSTGFKFGIDGDYYLMSVSEGVKCYRNLYATDFVADGWLYCSEVHSSGAVVIGADSESFYWAHGYQIARGTSWGGVCVGDDSQQLRLYGSSIWASHSISTSDENLKENFTTLDQYENFYMNLNPIGFNYIGDYDGKKTHFGFGAHKTEDVLESEGYDADKFAVVTHRPLVQEDIEKRFGKDVEVDIETEYGVSYTEFIALNTHMIQKTRRELIKVKQEKADLETRLQAIEAKLGL